MSISWKNWKRGFATLLIALGAHATAFAQTPTFSLEGVVSDAQQAVLPGATVTITNTATGLTRAVVTDAGGRYVIGSMPTEGRFRVQVELAGFATARELMDARRAVAAARRAADPAAERAARDRVHAAKVALGERGTPWWIEPRS